MHRAIAEKQSDIAAICRRHGVRRLDVFGSGAREDEFDAARSDADFLVDFGADTRPGLVAWFALHDDLRRVLGRDVDLLERQMIEASRNYIRRRHILNHLEPVYVA